MSLEFEPGIKIFPVLGMIKVERTEAGLEPNFGKNTGQKTADSQAGATKIPLVLLTVQ